MSSLLEKNMQCKIRIIVTTVLQINMRSQKTGVYFYPLACTEEDDVLDSKTEVSWKGISCNLQMFVYVHTKYYGGLITKPEI